MQAAVMEVLAQRTEGFEASKQAITYMHGVPFPPFLRNC